MGGWLNEGEQRAWRGLLLMTERLATRLATELQDSAGLSPTDYAVLVALTDVPDGRLRVFELLQALQWEQSRLSHQLTRMDRRGLIRKENCSSDRRGAVVHLTSAGMTALSLAAPEHVKLVHRLVFDGLTGEQVENLQSVISHVLARLDDEMRVEGDQH